MIADCALIAPGAIISRFVRLGRSCSIGAGAMIHPRLQIGDGALIGMGAVVLRDAAAGTTVVENAASPLVRANAA